MLGFVATPPPPPQHQSAATARARPAHAQPPAPRRRRIRLPPREIRDLLTTSPPTQPEVEPHHHLSPPSKTSSPTLFDFNIKLKGIARKKNRLPDCLALLTELRAHGLRPDKYTYSLLLTSCARAGDLDTGIQLFQNLNTDHVVLDDHLRTNLLAIAASAKPPRLDFCVRLFRMGNKPNRVMCNVMMDAFARCGKVDECLTTFRHMALRGLSPDPYTVSALVKAFVTVGRLDQAVHKIEDMRRAGLDVPAAAFGQVIHAYGKRGLMDEAVAVFDLMTLYGVQPTQITYNILIGACAHVKMQDRAFDIFEEMKHTSGFPGDRYTYHSLMKVCLAVHNGQKALQLYRDIRWSNFQCNQVSYRYALIAAGQIMDLDAVLQVAQDMKDAGCTPREDTLATLVGAAIRCSDLESALSFFSEFADKKPAAAASLFDVIRNALRSFEKGRGVDFEQTSRVVDELERSWRRDLVV